MTGIPSMQRDPAGEERSVRETQMPGVGTRFEFETGAGQLISVVHHRTGRRTLSFHDPDDPDRVALAFDLGKGDSRTLAEMLGGSRLIEHLAELQRTVEGLAVDRLPVSERSPFAGRRIADSQARTRTGVSIVAILRQGQAIPAPGPEAEIEAGDTLVVVGTPRGIEDLVAILHAG